MRTKLCVAGLIVAFSAAAQVVPPRANAQVEEAVIYLEVSEGAKPTWANYKCTDVNACPAGVKVDTDRNMCSTFFGYCVGSCDACPGSNSSGLLCLPHSNSECSFGTGATGLPCGTTTNVYDCSSSGPFVYGPGPNGCGCVGVPGVKSINCAYQQCQVGS